jgi:hypothetical protein
MVTYVKFSFLEMKKREVSNICYLELAKTWLWLAPILVLSPSSQASLKELQPSADTDLPLTVHSSTSSPAIPRAWACDLDQLITWLHVICMWTPELLASSFFEENVPI